MVRLGFWKWMTMAAIAALFYIGHALHAPGTADHLSPPLQAGGAAVIDGVNIRQLYTCSEDGKTVYVWNVGNVNSPQFVGKVEVPEAAK